MGRSTATVAASRSRAVPPRGANCGSRREEAAKGKHFGVSKGKHRASYETSAVPLACFEELRHELQAAIQSRAAGILERYQEVLQPAGAKQAERACQERLVDLASALRQLTEAERQRGKFLRSLRGDLESVAADLRAEVCASAASSARAAKLGTGGGTAAGQSLPPPSHGMLGHLLAQAIASQQRALGRGKRTLRD
eukprot:CAMPEP_0115105868 /NCGR_PEP_ID=MMETSP0227-20121206/36277_1 /TAXON_ID=89957 /ORGANISM="Polarella glacialis, Strain CCMP 1383" /LENGTH=195 /DNA_ID=CAMNT_0002503279 /DNA_START=176 /DNA_END=763 /DNA_ORIENTATION=+